MAINQLNLLKTARFLPIFITQFFGAFNDNLFKTALVTLVTFSWADQYSYDANFIVILSAAIFMLPVVLFSAIAGQISDGFEKSKIIRILKVCDFFIIALSVAGIYFENIFFLMFVLFLIGLQSAFFGPLKYSILPEHLNSQELLGGNGLIEMATFIAILLGSIMGTRYGNLSTIFLLSGLLFTSSAIGLFSSFFIPKTIVHEKNLKINWNIFSSSLDIIRYSAKKKTLMLSIIGISWFWLLGATYVSQFPTYVKDVIHGDSEIVMLLLTTFSIGIGLGSMFCNRLLGGEISPRFVPIGAVGMAIFGIDLFFASNNIQYASANTVITLKDFIYNMSNIRIIFDVMAISISGGIYVVPLYAILQVKTPRRYGARVIAGNNIMNALFIVIGSLFSFLLMYFGFSISQIFLVISMMSFVVALYICKLYPFSLVQSIIRILLHFLYDLKVIGMENYAKAGDKVVIVSNHVSLIDGLILSAVLPERVVVAVYSEIANKWWMKAALLLSDIYPVDPLNPMAVRSLIKEVKDGRKCLIFPEGRITVTGSLMKVNEGSGVIADKADAKILPIKIEGANHTIFSYLKGKVRIQWFPKITVTLYAPEVIDVNKAIKGRERRGIISRKLYDIMTKVTFLSSDCTVSLFQSLINAEDLYGKNHKIIEDIKLKPLSYRQLIFKSLLLGSLIKNEIKNQPTVGILLPNITEHCVLFFALQSLGVVSAILNFSTGSKGVLSSCNVGKIQIIYTSSAFVEKANLSDMIALIKENNIKVVYIESLRSKISILKLLTSYFTATFPMLFWRSKNIKADNAAVILFTSGSEGTPKGVVLSHANLQANRFQLTSVIAFTSQDIAFNALPMFHAFGLSAGTLMPILSGIKTFLYPSPLHYRMVPIMSYNVDATILFGTNTFLAGYAKYAHSYDFYSLRYVFSGAEKLQEGVRRIYSDKFGVRILEGYGATETAPVLAINNSMYNQPDTVGRLLPGIEYKLESVAGVEEGKKLIVKGPNIMLGYLLSNNPGTLVPLQAGWYDTGDIVDIDERGFISIKGRVKRFAKIAGEMISLNAVELFIQSVWNNNMNAIVNIVDEKKGEKLVLITDNIAAERTVLFAAAKEQGLSLLFVPKEIIILQKVPLLGSGKFNYVEMAEIAKNQ